MTTNRWVHCDFCQQTYAAGRGERCSPCGKSGGLRDVPRPAIIATDRDSWAPAAGSGGGSALMVGCAGMMIGAVLGSISASACR